MRGIVWFECFRFEDEYIGGKIFWAGGRRYMGFLGIMIRRGASKIRIPNIRHHIQWRTDAEFRLSREVKIIASSIITKLFSIRLIRKARDPS
jgi:hypothetical protein